MSAYLDIDVARQQLRLVGGAGEFSAPVSTSRVGLGCEPGSDRTPTGRFAIYSLHGENAPANTVFASRLPVGTWPAAGGEDAILARIITLEGLEAHNANTRSRCIYIHGTAEVGKIGQPVSHGCIRLAPADMVRLFELVELGMEVVINEQEIVGG